MSIDKAKWIEGYAKESHEDRVMSIVEDGSCLDLLVKMALESVSLRADLEHERLRAEGAERESADANRVLAWHREQTVKSVADNMTASDTIAALRAELAEARANRQHCPTCICGKRAPVQGDDGRKGRGPGSITWAEHLLAWSGYAARYGTGQSAERMAERGGFGFGELQMFLGHEPTTWEPRPATGDER